MTGILFAIAGAAMAFALGAGTLPAAAQHTIYHFKDDPIAWSACPDAAIVGLECANYQVPLDYRHADGTTIDLALRRMPATDVATGILFFNPGGPGGTGTGQFPQWYGQFPEAVRQSFDIVSWDPRGVGESTQAKCFDDGSAEAALIGDLGAFPTSYTEQGKWSVAYAALSEACAAKAANILAHFSTADVARDLEQLRLAAGGAKLNYWGVSYGTFLGATYANLFPDNIRTLVLDGNLSPLAWTANGNPKPQWPLGDRIGSYAVADVFQHFLRHCAAAGMEKCAFAEASYDLTALKWNALLNRLSAGPIELKSVDGVRTITLNTLVGQISDGMDIVWPLPGANGWASVGQALQALHEAGKAAPSAAGATAEARPAAVSTAVGAASGRYDGAEGVIAVICGDAPTVALDRFPTLASEAQLRSGYFGLSTSYAEFPCSSWIIRAADPYAGPWNTPLSVPPLVVNTTHDPSTPMPNAEAMVDLLSGARLLKVNGYGHTTLLNRSTCANDLIATYLLDQKLPSPDIWCTQDRQPFEEQQPQ
jgi:pimeloyl-ACP methyl ester carboxylesterase